MQWCNLIFLWFKKLNWCTYIFFFFYVAKWIPLDEEEQCWWLQSYDCIVALYLHNILFTSLLVEFYFSIWKSCIWCGEKSFLFYSIYFVYFVCMHEDQTMTDIVLILILCMYMIWKWIQILKMCMHWFSSDIVQWMTTKIRLQRIMYQLWSMSLSEIFLWLNLQYVYF